MIEPTRKQEYYAGLLLVLLIFLFAILVSLNVTSCTSAAKADDYEVVYPPKTMLGNHLAIVLDVSGSMSPSAWDEAQARLAGLPCPPSKLDVAIRWAYNASASMADEGQVRVYAFAARVWSGPWIQMPDEEKLSHWLHNATQADIGNSTRAGVLAVKRALLDNADDPSLTVIIFSDMEWFEPAMKEIDAANRMRSAGPAKIIVVGIRVENGTQPDDNARTAVQDSDSMYIRTVKNPMPITNRK